MAEDIERRIRGNAGLLSQAMLDAAAAVDKVDKAGEGEDETRAKAKAGSDKEPAATQADLVPPGATDTSDKA